MAQMTGSAAGESDTAPPSLTATPEHDVTPIVKSNTFKESKKPDGKLKKVEGSFKKLDSSPSSKALTGSDLSGGGSGKKLVGSPASGAAGSGKKLVGSPAGGASRNRTKALKSGSDLDRPSTPDKRVVTPGDKRVQSPATRNPTAEASKGRVKKTVQADDIPYGAEECRTFAKAHLLEIRTAGMARGEEGELLFAQPARLQNQRVELSVVKYMDGEIRGEEGEDLVQVLRHTLVLEIEQTAASKIRGILSKTRFVDFGREELFLDHWGFKLMTEGGSGLSLRYSGKVPASADGTISDPHQPTSEIFLETPYQAKALDEIGRQIDASRITSDEAAMALAERSQDERHATRLAEKIAREDKEEKSRPDRVWKAVKDGKERLVAELLEKPFKQSKPAVPLIQMRDVSGWTLCHWAAFFNHRDVIITLLKHGHPLSPVDGTGNTPLHLAAFNGADKATHLLLSKIAETEGGDVAHEKLVNQPNVFGSTPLMEAACNEHGAVSAELFQAKGDWNPSDDAHRRRSQSPPTSTHSGGHSHSPRPKSRGHTPGGERGHTRSPGPAARGVSPVAKTRHKPQSSIH